MASQPTRLAVNLRTVRTCLTQKVGFASHGEAWDVAELMMLRGEVNPGCHVTPYKCPDCHQWHVRNKVIVPIGYTFKHRGGA